MRRVRHDLPGVTQRIAKLANEYELDIEDTQKIWQDSKGRTFFRQRTSEIKPIVNQLTSTMSQLIELVDRIAAQVKDPDKD